MEKPLFVLALFALIGLFAYGVLVEFAQPIYTLPAPDPEGTKIALQVTAISVQATAQAVVSNGQVAVARENASIANTENWTDFFRSITDHAFMLVAVLVGVAIAAALFLFVCATIGKATGPG